MWNMLYFNFTVISSLFWCAFYRSMRNILKEKPPEFANRIVTFFHGTTVAFFGIFQCNWDGWVFYKSPDDTSIMQASILLISLGYFIFDLMWCMHYKTETQLMIAHHIYTVFAILRVLSKGNSAHQSTCALGLMELTNPLLQIRWFIRHFGYHRTILFYAVEGLFFLLFLSMRILLGSIVTVQVFLWIKDWEFKLLALTIYLVSWGFVINMFAFIRRKYGRNKSDIVAAEAT